MTPTGNLLFNSRCLQYPPILVPLTKSIMGETRVSAFTTDELSRHHPWKQDSSPSCLGPQAFMVKDYERGTVFILTLAEKRPGTECIHGNSWRQWVHSCPLPSSPNTCAVTLTRPTSTCSQTGGQDIILTCPLNRSLAPGRCCPSQLSCWPSSGGTTLTVDWGSLAWSSSPCLSLTSDPNISTPETGIKKSSPWTRTTACDKKFK